MAARGIDIPEVASVIHYDLPRSGGVDTFVHRSGRTAVSENERWGCGGGCGGREYEYDYKQRTRVSECPFSRGPLKIQPLAE